MRVRKKDDHSYEGSSNQFNTHGFGEIIIRFPEGDMDSDDACNYEVQLSDGSWVGMLQAFKDNVLISDNYNQYFKEAKDDEERRRGWY